MRHVYALILVTFPLACGGPQTITPPSNQTKSSAHGMSTAPNFAAQLQTKLAERSSGDAQVTFAILGQGELADEKELSKTLERLLRRPASSVRGRKLRPLPRGNWPTVISAKVDSALPLDIDGLAAESGELAGRIRGASHIAFLRYQGPRLAGDTHLWHSALAINGLSNTNEQIIVDLSTRQAFALQEWRANIGQANWLERQVVPGAEKDRSGTITFFSRGMAKFGLPDLEMSNIQSTEARQQFESFLIALSELKLRRTAKVGDSLSGSPLMECARSPEAIEHRCVALSRRSMP